MHMCNITQVKVKASQKAGTLEISVIEDPIYDLVLVAQNLLYYTIVQIADVFPILLGTSPVGRYVRTTSLSVVVLYTQCSG